MIRREIKCPMLMPRLRRCVIDSDGTPTVLTGAQDVSTSVSSGNASNVTLAEISKSLSLPFVTAGDGASAGTAGTFNDPYTATTFVGSSVISGGGTEAAEFHSLILGFDIQRSTLRKVTPQTLKASWLSPQLDGLRVANDGSVTFGSSAYTVVKNGNGDYSVTMKRPFKGAPVVAVNAEVNLTNSRYNAKVDTVTKSSFNVLCYDHAGTPADIGFHAFIAGSGHRNDSVGKRRKPVLSAMFRPRLLGFSFGGAGSFTADPPDLVGNGVAITDTATGQYDIVFDKPFKYPPIVVASASTASNIHIRTTSTTQCQLACVRTDNGAFADRTVNVMVLGTDVSLLR